MDPLSCSILKAPSAAGSTALPAPRSCCSSGTSARAIGCSTSAAAAVSSPSPPPSSAPPSAVGIENDAEANPVAWRNAERNGVSAAVDFLEGDAGDLAPLLGPADLLLSNILRLVNTALLPAIVAALRPGGLAIFSGMEQLEAPLFRPALETAGLVVRDEVADTGLVGGGRGTAVITVLVPPGIVTPGSGVGRRERLDDAEQHHLRVRRAHEGERVALRDGAGLVGIGRIAIVGKAWEVEVENAERRARPAALTLAVGAGDRERFGWLVEKAVELGATRDRPAGDGAYRRRGDPRPRQPRRKVPAPGARGDQAVRRRMGGRGRCSRPRWRRSSTRNEAGPPLAGGRRRRRSAGHARRRGGHDRHRPRGRPGAIRNAPPSSAPAIRPLRPGRAHASLRDRRAGGGGGGHGRQTQGDPWLTVCSASWWRARSRPGS